MLLPLQGLKSLDFLLFFGLVATLVLQSVRDNALHNTLGGHIIARVDQLEDGFRLGQSIRIDLAIFQRNGCAAMADDIDFEVLQQLLGDAIGSSNHHLVDELQGKRGCGLGLGS